jgi:5'-nucleotidase
LPYSLEDKLVIATSSSALFDTTESDKVFREQGADAYKQYQREREAAPFDRGPAFPFIERLLRLNDPVSNFTPVEVVLLSRNSADSGLRAMNSIAHYNLPITRAAFTSGRSPFRYNRSFHAVLFLSANQDDVMAAIREGLPGGLIMGSYIEYDQQDAELRIAFDFDGILADDSAERVYQEGDLAAFHRHEHDHGGEPLGEGPLKKLLQKIARIQQIERERKRSEPDYHVRLRTAIVTARNAPAHVRPITTLRSWGIDVDEVFFLGGVDKAEVLAEFRPHIFFDDQKAWAESATGIAAAVHVPFGVVNEQLNQQFGEASAAAE